MKNRFRALVLGLIMSIMAQPALADKPRLEDYMSTPFWLEGRTVPLVMLVLERDWKMFYPAYNNLADLDDDGAIDIGFNPNVTYVGYFDSNSCYKYNDSSTTVNPAVSAFFVRSGPTVEQDQDAADALFNSAASAGIDRNKSTLTHPASIHGVCKNGSENTLGEGLWHGNWLNYALTSRMDAIRKVLYGGKRVVDTADSTVLEMIRVPANANVWGGELYANDLWEAYAPSSPWYDIESFTGFSRPASGNMHFWARADYYWTAPINSTNALPTSTEQDKVSRGHSPLFRVVPNVPSTNMHPFLKTPLRIWDWIGDHSGYISLPYDGMLAKSKQLSSDGWSGVNNYGNFLKGTSSSANVARHFAARVQVCNKDDYSPTEGCKVYGKNVKPIGLLQEYGEDDRMFFGLLTGTIHHPSPFATLSGTRYKGGVVRHHIQNFDRYVHPDGRIVRKGHTIPNPTVANPNATEVATGSLIETIDVLDITGVGAGYLSGTYGQGNANRARIYGNGSQAGNPLGEMVWEALRYLGGAGSNPRGNTETAQDLIDVNLYKNAGGLQPTEIYFAGSETPVPPVGSIEPTYTLPVLTTKNSGRGWAGRPRLRGNANDCPKPVILALSEVFSDHDGDDLPSSLTATTGLDNLDFIGDFKDPPEDLVKTFDLKKYLKVIAKKEGLYTSTAADAKKRYFFYPDERGLCTGKALDEGFIDPNTHELFEGHCPSEPSLEGGYSLAAVAYYAHIHKFGSLSGEGGKKNNVDFYAVGIPGNFPDIIMKLDNDRSMTLMPITLAKLTPASGGTTTMEGAVDTKFKTLLNFFIEYWKTDDGETYKVGDVVKVRNRVPYKIKFSTNFEFTTYPCFDAGGNSNNWERDIFTTFVITMLVEPKSAADYTLLDDEPLYINSGPFKTLDRDGYIEDRKKYRKAVADAGGDPDKVSPQYYFTSQTYYYGFKKRKGVDLKIIEHADKVVGLAVHSDSYGSGYGAGGLGGYTISGVSYPGAYVDVGLYRSDYPVYYTSPSTLKPHASAFKALTRENFPSRGLTKDYDEPVPLDPAGSGIPGAIWNYNGSMHSPHYLTNANDCTYYHPPTLQDVLLTPAECPAYNYKDADKDSWDNLMKAAYPELANGTKIATDVCGVKAAGNPYTSELLAFRTSLMRYVQVRSFRFDTSDNKPEKLPNPMWLAAKYGGFKDHDNNGYPSSPGEWKRNLNGQGVGADDPYNYFGVANMSDLPTQLGNAFEAIANSVATGTAHASSINTVLGGGLSIQALYNPEYKDDAGHVINWTGSVYAFFVDKWGNLRADTNRDYNLNVTTSPPSSNKEGASAKDKELYKELWKERGVTDEDEELGDLIVHTVTPRTTKRLYEAEEDELLVYLCRDMYGDNNGNTPLPTDVAYVSTLPEDYVEGDKLNPDYPDHVDCQPIKSFDKTQQVWNAAAMLSEQGHVNRKVYSYFDIETGNKKMHPADGQNPWPVGGVDIKNYVFDSSNKADLHNMMGQIDVDTTENLINYIRGQDGFDQYRSRTAVLPWTDIITNPTVARPWIMGDVINSKPIIVGDATSNYHLLYGAKSYSDFKSGKGNGEAARRRQMSYFGANDGMLYAVNLGFFGSIKNGLAGYADSFKTKAEGGDSDSEVTLYPDYKSNTPKLGEVLWSYVPPALLPHLQWLADKEYQHGFFVDLKPYAIDITKGGGSSEWRTIMLVGLRMGGKKIEVYKNGLPTGNYSYSEYFAMDVTDPDSGPPRLLWRFSDPELGLTTATPAVVRSGQEWYAVLPSGPTDYDGTSTQAARLFVVNANTGELGGVTEPLVAEEANSFFNDTFLPRATIIADDGESWNHHVVYMGLTARDSSDRNIGSVYRLQMADNGVARDVKNWTLTRMFKADRPVTGAVNAAYDPRGNLWVVFGTGRVWSGGDLAPCGGINNLSPAKSCCDDNTQYIFGLKEPLHEDTQFMTYEEIINPDIDPYPTYKGRPSVGGALVDVSGLEVFSNGNVYLDESNSDPISYDSIYESLISKTAGNRGYKRAIEGWRTLYTASGDAEERPRPTQFEVITTQAKIDGLANGRSNSVVTTYLTSANICEPNGKSFLNVLDTYTGLPAPYMSSYNGFEEGRSITLDDGSVVKQMTGIKRAGGGMASEAWILKSGSQTIYGNTSFNSTRNMIYVPQDQSEGNNIVSWREVLDMDFDLLEDDDSFFKDLK